MDGAKPVHTLAGVLVELTTPASVIVGSIVIVTALDVSFLQAPVEVTMRLNIVVAESVCVKVKSFPAALSASELFGTLVHAYEIGVLPPVGVEPTILTGIEV